MILLNLTCNNIFLFQNLSLDFTYNRKLNYEIAQNDLLFPDSKIKVRKSIIIMGANATGKTTLGRLLCLIYNYLICRDEATAEIISHSINQPDKESTFSIEFAIEKVAYRLLATFDKDGLLKEELRTCLIQPSYNITTLREKLSNAVPMQYDRNESKEEILNGFRSYLLRLKKNASITTLFRKALRFWFALSSFHNDPIGQSGLSHLDIPMISQILPTLDNSIKSVIPLIPQIPAPENAGALQVSEAKSHYDSEAKSYTILLKNGKSQTVPDGNLGSLRGNRLSQGTTEAILYSSILSYLKHAKCSTIYVDECLSHMHSELEKYLIWLSILLKEKDSQLFFTTHNVEICDLQLPTNAFLFLKRNKEGLNEAFWANTKLIKNDRSFRNYYENDYFGVLPDYSSLIALLHKEGE